jgi:sugar phosphate isomerase/epimerase
MKSTMGIAATACAMALLMAAGASAQEGEKGMKNAEALGWRVGCQAYSFNRYTFFEAVDKTAEAGMHYIEAYPGQKFSPEKPDAVFDHNMSPDLQKEALAKLAASNVKLVNYGVVGLGEDEAENRKVFEFAKAMGIETIVSEPPIEALPAIDKLCQEYGINVALHNHPKPSKYWDDDTVLNAVKDLSPRVGACADTGHWMRSGIRPLDAIKKLEGRIISLHFKDLAKFGVHDETAHDVPWGTGEADVKALLNELHRQGFKGVFSAEYEYNWENSVPEITQSAKYFDQAAGEIAKAEK